VKRNIGRLEAQLLAYAQMRAWTTVRTGDLRTPMRLRADQERKLFSRLARAGMIARVWRGRGERLTGGWTISGGRSTRSCVRCFGPGSSTCSTWIAHSGLFAVWQKGSGSRLDGLRGRRAVGPRALRAT
jgi:hypothetical protein